MKHFRPINARLMHPFRARTPRPHKIVFISLVDNVEIQLPFLHGGVDLLDSLSHQDRATPASSSIITHLDDHNLRNPHLRNQQWQLPDLVGQRRRLHLGRQAAIEFDELGSPVSQCYTHSFSCRVQLYDDIVSVCDILEWVIRLCNFVIGILWIHSILVSAATGLSTATREGRANPSLLLRRRRIAVLIACDQRRVYCTWAAIRQHERRLFGYRSNGSLWGWWKEHPWWWQKGQV